MICIALTFAPIVEAKKSLSTRNFAPRSAHSSSKESVRYSRELTSSGEVETIVSENSTVIKVDKNRDGIVDLFSIDRDDTRVEGFANRGGLFQIVKLRTREKSGFHYSILQYSKKNKSYQVVFYKRESFHKYLHADACDLSVTSLETLSKWTNDAKLKAQAGNYSSAMKESCQEGAFKESGAQISEAMAALANAFEKKEEGHPPVHRLASCLGQKLGDPFIGYRMRSHLLKYQIPRSDKALPEISCNRKSGPPASFDESTKVIGIHAIPPKTYGRPDQKVAFYSALLSHELLHRAGLAKEKATKDAVSCCLLEEDYPKCKADQTGDSEAELFDAYADYPEIADYIAGKINPNGEIDEKIRTDLRQLHSEFPVACRFQGHSTYLSADDTEKSCKDAYSQHIDKIYKAVGLALPENVKSSFIEACYGTKDSLSGGAGCPIRALSKSSESLAGGNIDEMIGTVKDANAEQQMPNMKRVLPNPQGAGKDATDAGRDEQNSAPSQDLGTMPPPVSSGTINVDQPRAVQAAVQNMHNSANRAQANAVNLNNAISQAFASPRKSNDSYYAASARADSGSSRTPASQSKLSLPTQSNISLPTFGGIPVLFGSTVANANEPKGATGSSSEIVDGGGSRRTLISSSKTTTVTDSYNESSSGGGSSGSLGSAAPSQRANRQPAQSQTFSAEQIVYGNWTGVSSALNNANQQSQIQSWIERTRTELDPPPGQGLTIPPRGGPAEYRLVYPASGPPVLKTLKKRRT